MNNCNLLGRITRDVEVAYTQANNMCVAKFCLAVNRRFAKEGDQQADFINCIAFGKTAEFCSKYFTKGQQIALDGRIQTRSYDNKEGKKVYVTEVIAENVYFADSKKEQTSVPTSETFMQVEEEGLPF